MSARGSRPRNSAAVIVVGVAVLLVVAFTAVQRWRIVRDVEARALPAHAGRLPLAGLGEGVEVLRDEQGVPRIRAASEADAWRALGFVHAQDRLAQMLWLRRLARGQVSEVVGTEGLPADRFVRTLGLGRHADAALARVDRHARRVLEAYSQGVNARIERVRSGAAGLPVAIADWPAPEPWTPGDSVAVVKLISWASSSSLDTALVLDDLIERLGGLGARPFFPTGGAVQGVGVPLDLPGLEEGAARASLAPVSAAPASDAGRARFGSGYAATAEALLSVAAIGGNAWVAGPGATQSGAPLLGAQLHLAPTAPSLVYEASLQAGDWRLSGAAVPGVPVFWIGRSRDVAWAVTPARAVAADLYLVTLRPGEPSQYKTSGRWIPLEEHSETIRVRDELGGLRSESWVVRRTRQGPLVNDLIAGEREPLALAWTGARSGDPVGALIDLATAEDGNALLEVLRRHHDPVVSVAWVDRAGNGGVKVAGWIPQRILPTSLVPVPGRMRAFLWNEAIEFDELPEQRLSDEETWVVSADESFDEGRGSPRIEWLWRPGLQARRIDEILSGAPGGRVDGARVAAMLADRHAPGASEVVPAILALAAPLDALPPGAREVVHSLTAWDHELGSQSVGALVYRLFLAHLTRALFEPVVGRELLDRYLALPYSDAQAMLEAILSNAAHVENAAGWSDRERVSNAVYESLDRTWVSLGYRLGPNPERWSWGRLHPLRFVVFPGLESADSGLAPVPAAGDGSSLFMADPRPSGGRASNGSFPVSRASFYRAVVDFDATEMLSSAAAPGQSEHPSHPNHADRLGAWLGRGVAPQLDGDRLEVEPGVVRLSLEPVH